MFGRIVAGWSQLAVLAKVAIVAVAVVVGAVGVALTSPLVIRTSIDEPFPVAQSSAPTSAVDAMTDDAMAEPTAEGAMAEDTMAEPTGEGAMAEDAMAEPTAEGAMVEPTAVTSEPVVLSQGSFTRVDALHSAEGLATIYALPDGQRVLRLEEFTSLNGPDLYVGLSGHAMPRSNPELHDQGYVQLARLKASEGNQNYELPADLDLSGFKSVVIYCQAFSVVFSTAELITQPAGL